MERLREYLDQPNQPAELPHAALQHIGACPSCRGRLGYLTRALAAGEEDRVTCEECEAALPLLLAGDPALQARRGALTLHLATCPACAAACADLADLLALAHAERGVEPPAYPAPRFPWLQQPAIPAEEAPLRRLLIQLTHDLVASWRPPALAAARKAAGDATLYELRLDEPARDLRVTLLAEREQRGAATCVLTVTVELPSRGWGNYGGSTVTLRRPGRDPEQAATDRLGQVVFTGIPDDELARLAVEVVAAD